MFSIFSKTEYKDVTMPFKYVESKEDIEGGCISIVAFGNVLGQMKYCYASYCLKEKAMYNNGDYEQIINLLKNNNNNKEVKVKIIIKNDKAKDFKIDLASLADIYNDERFNKLDLAGWGFHDKEIANW